ncbi:hypothetical protein TNIN_30431 [Trichonephila inaurata madagascariensis]|uniref:Uncharacterized protein n=1 Tax=Trichonephila inaurata madagascariensis TaxID=2747483 RepID=A0A8X6YED0_9ARAC|nr:hypothetical protein TNIN_30431 [Trichonephila inaurata madagascariensis]
MGTMKCTEPAIISAVKILKIFDRQVRKEKASICEMAFSRGARNYPNFLESHASPGSGNVSINPEWRPRGDKRPFERKWHSCIRTPDEKSTLTEDEIQK